MDLSYPFTVEGFHAHVYFNKDDDTYSHALDLRTKIQNYIIDERKLDVVFGGHGLQENAVGPHPTGNALSKS